MKISAQEEHGLRILIEIARRGGMTIAEISENEGITTANAGKICRILRLEGFIKSTRGHQGGYELAHKPEEINLKDLLYSLGGPLYCENYCERFTGENKICSNSTDCSIRSLWKIIQCSVDDVLSKLTLRDMLGKEKKVFEGICQLTDFNKLT